MAAVAQKRRKKTRKPPPSIEIARDLCKGCGICAAFCPRNVLALDDREKASVVRPEECTGCGACELRCPDLAIEIFESQQQDGSP